MKMLRRAILAMGFIFFVTGYTSAAIQDASSAAPSIGEMILADETIFHKDFIESIDLKLLRSNSAKIVYSVPEGQGPKMRKIQKKYGKPDTVVSEEITDFSTEGNTLESGVPAKRLKIYYYGGIGFGVDNNRAKGAVVLITNWVAPKPVNEGESADGLINPLQAEGAFDGDWVGSSDIGPLSFKVENNAIPSVRVEFMVSNGGCSAKGFTMVTFGTPQQISGNSFSVTSSGEDISFTLQGSFSSNSSASGSLAFTFSPCGVAVNVPWSATKQQSFTLTINPVSKTIAPGSSTSFTVGVQSSSGLTQLVSLSATVTPPDSSVTLSFSSNTVTPGNTATLTVETTPSTPPTTFNITVTGTAGQVVRTTTATVSVIGFKLAISPSSQTVAPGTSTSFKVDIQSVGGFAQLVSLSAAISPADSSLTASFSSVTVTPGDSTTLTINTKSSTPSGTFGITITGTAGQIVRTATATVSVTSDFTLGLSPVSQNVAAGSSTSFTINVQPVGGFTQPVNLSAAVAPSNSNVTAKLSASTATPGSNTTLTVDTTPTAPTSTFTITITGRSGQLAHTATAMVTVSVRPDFALTIDPSSQDIASGMSTSFTINAQAISGFADPINLSAALSPPTSGVTTSFSPSSVTPGGNAALTVQTAANTPTSTITITVTGTAGQLIHTTTTTVNVTQPDFALAFNPSTLSVTRGQKGQIMVFINRTENFAGNVTVTAPDTKAIKVKLTPPMQSTTGVSVSFNFKVKKTAPTGAQQLVFTGKDDSGRVRTAMLTLVIQ